MKLRRADAKLRSDLKQKKNEEKGREKRKKVKKKNILKKEVVIKETNTWKGWLRVEGVRW